MFQVKEFFRKLTFIGILTAMLLTACSSEEGIQVHNPWMMPAVQGNNAAVYFRLYNHTSEGDLLTGVSSAAAEAVELDESMWNGHLVQLWQVEHVLLPASTEVKFRSGALQVTLLGLKRDLKLTLKSRYSCISCIILI